MGFREKITKNSEEYLQSENSLLGNIAHMVFRLNKVFREDLSKFPYIYDFEIASSGIDKIIVDFNYTSRGDQLEDSKRRIVNFIISEGEIILLHDFNSSKSLVGEFTTGRKSPMRKLFEGLTLDDFDLPNDSFELKVRHLLGEI